MKKLKDVCYVFVCVTTCVVFVTAVYIKVFWPQQTSLTVDILWQILLVSFLCSMGIFLYPEREVSGRTMAFLYIIHYVEVNVVVLGCGIRFQWFYPNDLLMVLGMVIPIALIFILVSVITWNRNRRMAALMNERLQEYQNKAGDV